MPEFVIAEDTVTAISDTLLPGRPAVAFDGTNYLVVSCADASDPTGMFGTLVSEHTVIVDSFHIGAANCRSQPALAFDGTNYFVVYGDAGQIIGRRISPDGIVLDRFAGLTIASSGGSPSVAFNGTDYLVVWNDFVGGNHEIFGTRVNTLGQVLDAPPIEIFRGPGEQVLSAVASDGTDFLVVWQDTPTGSGPAETTNITGARVAADGSVVDVGGIPITTAPEAQVTPRVTFAAGNYFVAWVDFRISASPFVSDIFGTRVAATGAVLDGTPGAEGIPINTFRGAGLLKDNPDVGFDDGTYLVVWELSGFSDPAGLYAARVSTDGTLIDGPPDAIPGRLVSQPACFACRLVRPAVASAAETSLIAWTNNDETSGAFKDIIGAMLAFPPELTVSGVCPGDVTVTVSQAAPDGVIGLVWGTAEGSFTVPAGPCAGAKLGVADPTLLTTVVTDPGGVVSQTVTAPPGACGVFLQAGDLTTCTPSNVAQVP